MAADRLVRPGRLSLRLRYALIATSLSAAAFAAGGALALSLYRDSLDGNVEQALRTAAGEVAASARTGALPDPIPMPVAPSVPRIQVLDARGRIVTGDPASATGVALSQLAQAKPGRVFLVSDPAHLPEHRAAAITLGVSGRQGPLTVVAVASLDQADAQVGHALTLSGALAAVSLTIVALVAWMTTGRTLRRVEKLRARVTDVASSGDLTQRVTDGAGADELGRLSRTLDDMLVALAASSDRQRRFVDDAAHELRTPLAGITATLEIAARRPDTVDGHMIGDLLEAHRRLTRLVGDLLELAALDGGRNRAPRTVDWSGVVTDTLRRRPLPPAIEIRQFVNPVFVEGSETQLDRVFSNLLDNAVRHARSTVAVDLRKQDGFAVLSVADDGPGIGAAERDQVWDRFTRLEGHRSAEDGGTGLGLALVKEMVLAHHGTATVVSDPDLRGARFEIRLPALHSSQLRGTSPR